MTRGFLKVNEELDTKLPERQTKSSAGYDFYVIEDVEIPPFGMVMLPTNVKAYMQEDEYLKLCNRSSNPGKRGLILSNSIGIVDADYYGNPDNDGHIYFQIINLSPWDISLKKGDVIGQGILLPYFKTNDDATTEERLGGFGSTDNDK